MRLSDITVLGRSLDPSYPPNLAIGALSLVVGAAGAVANLFSRGALLEGVLWGMGAGLSVFLAWALAREFDPAHDLSAFAGTGLAIAALLVFDLPALMPIFWLLVVLRLVNRTVGPPARPLDTLAVLGLGGWLTWQGNWIAGLVTALAFLLDGLLANPLRYHLVLSGFAFAGTVVMSVFRGDIAMDSGPKMPAMIPLVVTFGLFLVVLVVVGTSREARAVGDATGEPLDERRVQAARLLALLAASLYAWWDGLAGVEALWPLWAATVGELLYSLAHLFLARGQSQA